MITRHQLRGVILFVFERRVVRGVDIAADGRARRFNRGTSVGGILLRTMCGRRRVRDTRMTAAVLVLDVMRDVLERGSWRDLFVPNPPARCRSASSQSFKAWDVVAAVTAILAIVLLPMYTSFCSFVSLKAGSLCLLSGTNNSDSAALQLTAHPVNPFFAKSPAQAAGKGFGQVEHHERIELLFVDFVWMHNVPAAGFQPVFDSVSRNSTMFATAAEHAQLPGLLWSGLLWCEWGRGTSRA